MINYKFSLVCLVCFVLNSMHTIYADTPTAYKDVSIYLSTGKKYVRSGEYSQAKEAFQSALDKIVDKNVVEADAPKYELLKLSLKTSEIEKQRLILDSCNIDQLTRIARLAKSEKEHKVAKECYLQQHELFTDNQHKSEALFEAAKCSLLFEPNELEGIKELQFVSEVYPETPGSRSAKAHIRALAGRPTLDSISINAELFKMYFENKEQTVKTIATASRMYTMCYNPFYRSYLSNESIPDIDRAQVHYQFLLPLTGFEDFTYLRNEAKKVVELAWEDQDLAAKAAYYIPMSYAYGQQWDQAEIEFDLYIRDYPESPFMPEAMYQLGETLRQQGKIGEAATVYDILIEKHSGSDAANKGRQMLNRGQFNLISPAQRLSASAYKKEFLARHNSPIVKPDGETIAHLDNSNQNVQTESNKGETLLQENQEIIDIKDQVKVGLGGSDGNELNPH